jgi:hypothetical protein
MSAATDGSEPLRYGSISLISRYGRNRALIFLVEDGVVDIRPNFFEDEDAAIDSQVSDPPLICFGDRPFLAWVVEIGCAGGSARTNDLAIVNSFVT